MQRDLQGKPDVQQSLAGNSFGLDAGCRQSIKGQAACSVADKR